MRQHPVGQVHPDQAARKRRDRRAAKPRSAACVQHVETMRRREARILHHGRDERRRTIRQDRQLRFEAGRKAVEGRLNEAVRCARGHIPARACRQHVPRDRIVRLLFEPLLEDLRSLAEFAQGAMRQRQKLARFAIFRPQRDHLAVARRGFPGALQGVEQNAQVGIRVDMFGVQPDGFAIRGFRFDRLSGRSQQHTQIVVGVGVTGIEGDRTPVRNDRRLQPALRLKDDAAIAAPVRLVGREREAALDQRERFVVAPPLVREHAGVMQRTGVIGRGLEDAAEQLVGLGELLVLLQDDRERDRFLERQRARR